MPPDLSNSLGIIGGTWLILATLLTNIAAGFVLVGACLGCAAFALWWRNRNSLRQLNDFLAERARAGFAVISEVSCGDGT